MKTISKSMLEWRQRTGYALNRDKGVRQPPLYYDPYLFFFRPICSRVVRERKWRFQTLF